VPLADQGSGRRLAATRRETKQQGPGSRPGRTVLPVEGDSGGRLTSRARSIPSPMAVAPRRAATRSPRTPSAGRRSAGPGSGPSKLGSWS